MTVRSCAKSRHHPRELVPQLQWCSRCGSYRRWTTNAGGRWSKWVPCGVDRINDRDVIACDARQLDLLDAALDDAQSALARAVLEVSCTISDLGEGDAATSGDKITAAVSGTNKPTLRLIR
jgi:hypothetical protein